MQIPIYRAVSNYGLHHFYVKGAVKAAQKMITPSEDIIWAQAINIYTKPIHGELITDPKTLGSSTFAGVFDVTDQRVLFVTSSLGIRSSKEMRLSSIRSIDSKNSLTTECMRITGTTEMIVAFAKQGYLSSLRSAINDALEKKNVPQASAPASTVGDDDLSSSDVEQLQTLEQFYDTGVITAEEFAAKKAQILGI